MKLMRNTTADGSCKYALIRLDRLSEKDRKNFIAVLDAGNSTIDLKDSCRGAEVNTNIRVELGRVDDPDEFFVIKLKDRHAASALNSYAASIIIHSDGSPDLEYFNDVMALQKRAESHRDSKLPD